MKCFECGTTEDIQHHHVVPKSRGGAKTVPLCFSCHRKAHGKDGEGSNHRKLVKEGMAAAKDLGAVFGNPRWEESLPEIREMGHEANRQRGDSSFWRVLPFLKDGNKAGCKGTSSYVRYLNKRGCFTPRGKDWKQGSLYRFVKRAKKEKLIP